ELLRDVLKAPKSPQVVLGPGDDCSAVEFDDEHYLISTTDCLVEGYHFLRNHIRFCDLGYKSLAVNLSDISAMGGIPLWCHLSFAFPKSLQDSDVKQFFSGIYNLSEKLGIELLGGDLSASEEIFINIHLSGLVRKSNIKTRKGFSNGDILCVTGDLGDSSAGLKLLLSAQESISKKLVQKHRLPPIRSSEARHLAKWDGVTGMMDISDGLASDLLRLNHCDIEIDVDSLPLSKELVRICETMNWDPYEFAFAGGEDYELLIAIQQDSFEVIRSDFLKEFSTPLTAIGRVKAGNGHVNFLKSGHTYKQAYQPFSHFDFKK
ncbi:MAG: thiamine-phosphate kinase, partial [Bdellovibrionales bacterium]|nr:thiamine-phosphate kinase [Bdellovibrionales bacterium]